MDRSEIGSVSMSGKLVLLFACLLLPLWAWGQAIIMGTSFENSEGWETHPAASNIPWLDTLHNGQLWEGSNLQGGEGLAWVSWVRQGWSDGVNFPDPASGYRYGVLELHGTLDDGNESYIRSDLLVNPGVLSFSATKSHRTAGGMEVQICPDGSADWETVRYINAEGDAAEIDKKLYWDLFDISINRVGGYYIRWIKTVQGATYNSKLFIDNIHVHPYDTPVPTATPPDTPTPGPANTPTPTPVLGAAMPVFMVY